MTNMATAFTPMTTSTFTNVFSNTVCRFRMKEELLSISQDDFVITDMQRNVESFRIRRQLMSVIRQTKTLYDERGNVVWTMKHPIFKMAFRKYKFYDVNGNFIFAIKNHFRLPGQGKKLTTTLPDGRKVISKGNLFDRTTPITAGGQNLATVEKPLISVRGAITGLSGYTLTVQPGMDIPLCFGFVAILDEERERSSTSMWKLATVQR